VNVLPDIPNDVLSAIAIQLAWWLESQAAFLTDDTDAFFRLAWRILEDKTCADSERNGLLFAALNSAVGHLSMGLLILLLDRKAALPQPALDEIWRLLSLICDRSQPQFVYGRVILARNAVQLFYADKSWTEKYLLPLFQWKAPCSEARAAWTGFLWAPRLYRPLLWHLKDDFLETAKHHKELEEVAKQYAALLTLVALDEDKTFAPLELAKASRSLPAECLEEAAWTLERALEGVGEQRLQYWTNRAEPYLQKVWPKAKDKVTPEISARLAGVCVAAEEAFDKAVVLLRAFLQPIPFPGHALSGLHERELCKRFPREALEFLDAIVSDDTAVLPRELKECLDQIGSSNRSLTRDRGFVRLAQLCERRGMT
jgi:hypothetical protein